MTSFRYRRRSHRLSFTLLELQSAKTSLSSASSSSNAMDFVIHTVLKQNHLLQWILTRRSNSSRKPDAHSPFSTSKSDLSFLRLQSRSTMLPSKNLIRFNPT